MKSSGKNSKVFLFQRIFVFLFIFLSSHECGKDFFSRWILWNVGQGQFFSLSLPSVCWHFDMGGEKISWNEIQSECGIKQNRLLLSHWDWDHISFIKQARRHLSQLCLDKAPAGPTPSAFKENIFLGIELCSFKEHSWVEINWKGLIKKKSNDWSRVFFDKEFNILIPGDSPSKQEKFWSEQNSPLILRTRFLIVGHHGSQTSSSPFLLRHLPHLSMGLISSRKKRYGHPHLKTINNFKKIGVPLISTENWGNIVIPLFSR